MFTVFVTLQVLPEQVGMFLDAIQTNARSSLRDEPGCLRFDVHRSDDDPHRFHLYEIYADEDAFHTAHRTTPHYAAWRKASERCLEQGGHVNAFAHPSFPEDMPEGQIHAEGGRG